MLIKWKFHHEYALSYFSIPTHSYATRDINTHMFFSSLSYSSSGERALTTGFDSASEDGSEFHRSAAANNVGDEYAAPASQLSIADYSSTREHINPIENELEKTSLKVRRIFVQFLAHERERAAEGLWKNVDAVQMEFPCDYICVARANEIIMNAGKLKVDELSFESLSLSVLSVQFRSFWSAPL
jgi:hypothetical protein